MTFSDAYWYPLSTWNPVPGDPAALRMAGQGYEQVAAQIQAAAANLRAVADGLTEHSEAVSEVQTKARKVAGQIERAHGRYAATGAALVTYAVSLARAQQIAQDALRQAQSAAAAQDNARQDMCYWSGRSSEVLPGQPAVDFQSQIDTARQNLFQTDRYLDQARATLCTATAMRDAAGEAARASIQAVGSADDLHDTIWQNLGGGAQEVGEWVWNGADEAAAWLGVVALALCWVPVLGEALEAVALIAGVFLLIRDGVNAATHNGTWDAVGEDALGLAAFGVGRVAAKGLSMAVNAARGAKALRVATVAEEAGGAMSSGGRSAIAATSRGSRAVQTAAVRAQAPGQASQAGELLRVLNPKVIYSDTRTSLSDGVRLFQSPGTGAVGRHVQGSPQDIHDAFQESWVNMGNAFKSDKTEFVFQAVGQDHVARDASFLTQNNNQGFGSFVRPKGGQLALGTWVGAKALDQALVIDSGSKIGN